jgi:hypothetical protein
MQKLPSLSLKFISLLPFFCYGLVPAFGQADEENHELEQFIDSVQPNKDGYFIEKNADSFTIEQRRIKSGHISKLRSLRDFWYVDSAMSKKAAAKEEKGYVPLGQRKWFQILIWLVIIGTFGAALTWYLATSNVRLFGRKKIPVIADEDAIAKEENIFVINYQAEINKAVNVANYRLAIRLLFLRLLKELSEKQIIEYKLDRTNLDYLLQLRNTGYYKSFFHVARSYEYAWYGKFDVAESIYRIIEKEFQQIDRELQITRA